MLLAPEASTRPIEEFIPDPPFLQLALGTTEHGFGSLEDMKKRGRPVDQDTIRKIVPELRHIARQYRATPAAIDDLVELTLRTAVDEKESQPVDMPLNIWLRGVMRRVVLH